MKRNRLLFLVITLGIIVQLFFLFFAIDANTLLWADPKHYLSIATELAHGESYSVAGDLHNLYRMPGYPVLLMLIIKIVGINLVNIRIVHVLLGGIFLLGVYKAGKEWKNDIFGMFFVVICSFYPYYLYIPLTLYADTLLIYIVPWILYCFIKIEKGEMDIKYLIFICLLSTVGILTRPTFIILPFIYACFYLLKKEKRLLRRFIVSTILLILPLGSLALWGLNNYNVHGRFIISTAGSLNLFKGFNENTTTLTKSDCPLPENVLFAIQKAENSYDVDSIYKHHALEFIISHPIKSTYLSSVRMLDLWNPLPHTSTSHTSILKKIFSGLPYTLILLLFLINIFFKKKKRAFDYMLLSILVLNTFANGLFAVSIRYRVIFDIIIILYALDYIWERLIPDKIKKYEFINSKDISK